MIFGKTSLSAFLAEFIKVGAGFAILVDIMEGNPLDHALDNPAGLIGGF